MNSIGYLRRSDRAETDGKTVSLDATFYGFATLADAKAAWHQQLARILSTMLDRGVIIDALLAITPRVSRSSRPTVPRLRDPVGTVACA